MNYIKQIFLSLVCLGISAVSFAADEGGAALDSQPAPDLATQAKPLLAMNLAPNDLRIFGDKTAPNTIYLFSSLSCPHCAVFHEEVLPDLMKQFIETKKAKLIIVDMPYDPKAITATLYARCVAPQNYEAYVDRIYSNLANLTYTENPRRMMADFALELGEEEEKLEVCVGGEALRKKIIDQRNNLSNLYLVKAMPTVVVVDNKSPLRLMGTDKAVLLRDIQNKLEGK